MQTNLSKISAFLGKYMGEKPKAPEGDTELLRLLRETQSEIARCRKNLMFADSDALLDMYIYSIKANELRYDHLLQLAKQTAI